MGILVVLHFKILPKFSVTCWLKIAVWQVSGGVLRRQWAVHTGGTCCLPLRQWDGGGTSPDGKAERTPPSFPNLPPRCQLELVCHKHQEISRRKRDVFRSCPAGHIHFQWTQAQSWKLYSLSRRSLLSFDLSDVKQEQRWSLCPGCIWWASRFSHKIPLAGNWFCRFECGLYNPTFQPSQNTCPFLHRENSFFAIKSSSWLLKA